MTEQRSSKEEAKSESGKSAVAPEKMVTVRMQRSFYKDSYVRVLLALFLSITLNLALGSILAFLVFNPPKPKYFATSVGGRIVPLVPLDKPNQSDSAILQWSNQAAIASYTYNFVNYRDELQDAARYYTREGWSEFTKALQDSKYLDIVKQKKLIVSAVASQAPIILQKGPLNGRYAWRIQMPVLVTYQSASTFTQQNLIITLLVVRVSTLETPRGIGIAQFIVARAGAI